MSTTLREAMMSAFHNSDEVEVRRYYKAEPSAYEFERVTFFGYGCAFKQVRKAIRACGKGYAIVTYDLLGNAVVHGWCGKAIESTDPLFTKENRILKDERLSKMHDLKCRLEFERECNGSEAVKTLAQELLKIYF